MKDERKTNGFPFILYPSAFILFFGGCAMRLTEMVSCAG